MAELITEWAGKERLFRLNFGDVMSLEEACGGQGIGAIYIRLQTGEFTVSDVWNTIRLGLIGGGEGVLDAKRLLTKYFDTIGYLTQAQIAVDIIHTIMTGLEPNKGESEEHDPAEPYKFSEVSQICRVFNMSPSDLRSLPYADFVNMMRGYQAATNKEPEFPTEEEFMDILDRYEPKD